MAVFHLYRDQERVTFNVVSPDVVNITYNNNRAASRKHTVVQARSIYHELLKLNYEQRQVFTDTSRVVGRNSEDCSERYRNTNYDSSNAGGWSNKH